MSPNSASYHGDHRLGDEVMCHPLGAGAPQPISLPPRVLVENMQSAKVKGLGRIPSAKDHSYLQMLLKVGRTSQALLV